MFRRTLLYTGECTDTPTCIRAPSADGRTSCFLPASLANRKREERLREVVHALPHARATGCVFSQDVPWLLRAASAYSPQSPPLVCFLMRPPHRSSNGVAATRRFMDILKRLENSRAKKKKKTEHLYSSQKTGENKDPQTQSENEEAAEGGIPVIHWLDDSPVLLSPSEEDDSARGSPPTDAVRELPAAAAASLFSQEARDVGSLLSWARTRSPLYISLRSCEELLNTGDSSVL